MQGRKGKTMQDTIYIEVEMVNTCFGDMARLWKGNGFTQVSVKDLLNEMNRLTAYYNNTCGAAVVFTVK